MLTELKLSARNLRKSPGLTLSVIVLLALGMTSSTVIFSVVDALLLRPLPVPHAQSLVRVVTVREPLGVRSNFYLEEYEAWKRQVRGFENLLAWSEQDLYLREGQATERTRVHFITDNFFSSLGARPALGRLLEDRDGQTTAGIAPAVLSYAFWQRRFHGDAGVVGRAMTLGAQKVLIVGVSEKSFRGMNVETSPDVRVPMEWLRTLQPDLFEGRIVCEVAGWIRPGFSRAAVQQHAEAVWRSGWKDLNGSDPGQPGVFSLEPAARGISRMRTQFAGVLWLLMGGAVVLMLMVCSNVAGLLMARTASREGELAVRVALGASRSRLMRGIISDAMVLMVASTILSGGLAATALPQVVRALPPVRDLGAVRLPLDLEIVPDWRLFVFIAIMATLVTLAAGVVPAVLMVRRELHPLLKAARMGGGWRGRQVMVTLQAGLCTLLLVGAGLMVHTLHRLETLDAGFRSARVVTFGVDPDMAKMTPQQAELLRRRLMEEARTLPQVDSVGAASRGLMRGTGMKMTVMREGEQATQRDFMNASTNSVSREYFATLGIPLKSGRLFQGEEDPKVNPAPVVVNESFAHHFGRGGSVIGMRFGPGVVNGAPARGEFEVIGVVGDAKYRSLREPFHPVVFRRLNAEDGFLLTVRTRSAPEQVIGPMREALLRVDPRLSFVEVTTLQEEIQLSLWPERVAASLAMGFSAAAVLIVAAGLYALVAFAVMQRKREIGVRLALGALPRNVVELMLWKAMLLVLAGVGCGAAAAWLLAPRVTPILYQVQPHDPWVFGMASGGALLVAALAAALPSLRAARVHPSSVLRQD